MTFIVQIISFSIFVAICMKWIWPPIIQAISNRQKEVSDSLEAVKSAHQDVELAKMNASKIIEEAKLQAQEIVDSAQRRKAQIVDEASEEAKLEKERILKRAKNDILAECNKAKEELRKEISVFAVEGARKIISKNLSSEINKSLLDEAIDKL